MLNFPALLNNSFIVCISIALTYLFTAFCCIKTVCGILDAKFKPIVLVYFFGLFLLIILLDRPFNQNISSMNSAYNIVFTLIKMPLSFLLFYFSIKTLDVKSSIAIRLSRSFSIVFFTVYTLVNTIVEIYLTKSEGSITNGLYDYVKGRIAFAHLISFLLSIIIFPAVKRLFIKFKKQVLLSAYDKTEDKQDVKKEIVTSAKFFLIVYAIYGMLYFFMVKGITTVTYAYWFLTILVLSSSIFIIQRDIIKQYSIEIDILRLRNERIFASVDDLTGLKHDIGNILQAYDGHILLKKYDKLLDYHKDAVRYYKNASAKFAEVRNLSNNPIIVSLLMTKYKQAEEHGIVLYTDTKEIKDENEVSSVKFCKVFGILIDNALEEALNTDTKEIKVIAAKVDNTYVIEIGNVTRKEINPTNAFTRGYSTKEGHSGQGLWEVLKIMKHDSTYQVESTYSNKWFNVKFIIHLSSKTN